MIQANELRTGNWVIPVHELQGEDRDYERLPPVILHWENLFEEHKHYDPIPLTSEILEKCGFEKGSYHDSYGNKANWQIIKPAPLQIDEIGGLYFQPYYITPLQYLHQLQNLYFALTNEELKIEF